MFVVRLRYYTLVIGYEVGTQYSTDFTDKKIIAY